MSTRQTSPVTVPPLGSGDALVVGEAVTLDVRPAGIASRGLALLVDAVIQGALTFGLTIVAVASSLHMNDATAQAIALVLYVLIVLGYPVGFETLAHGRTPGKMALGLRVVRDDGGPIRFRHAFVRGLVGVVLDRPGISLGVLALVPMLFSSRSKRLGDIAAGTMVLQERVPVRIAAPPPMPAHLEAWAATLDLSRVDDELASQVRQFLGRAGQLAPWAREDFGNRLVAVVATRTGGGPPPGMPGGTYLSAVLAERRRRDLRRRRSESDPAAPNPTAPSPAPGLTPEQAPERPGPFAPPG
jgi:uncharacterized RDD family membrane protein YckC